MLLSSRNPVDRGTDDAGERRPMDEHEGEGSVL